MTHNPTPPANPGRFNVAGEIGHKFSAMANDKETAMRSLRRSMTSLYSKSGRDNVAGGILYSSQDQNVTSVEGTSYSLIGESTPGTFFESLTRGMMEDGFMSRFNVIEYTGDRPSKNPHREEVPHPAVVTRIVDLMTHAHSLRARNEFKDVTFDAPSRALLDGFEEECDSAIRSAGDDEPQRQMWNRAHLKVLRMSALLAVGDNPFIPVVVQEQVTWAIRVVREDIAVFGRRIRNGEVGDGTDDGRESKLMDICRDYIVMEADEVPNFAKRWENARSVGLVARSYLQMKTQRLASFEKHSRGGKAALDLAIQAAIDNGRLFAVSTTTALEKYKLNFHGKLYGVLDLTSHRRN